MIAEVGSVQGTEGEGFTVRAQEHRVLFTRRDRRVAQTRRQEGHLRLPEVVAGFLIPQTEDVGSPVRTEEYCVVRSRRDHREGETAANCNSC